MVLYHGTDEQSARAILENGIDLFVGNIHTDFGQGFYLTTDILMAKQWSQRKGLFTRGAIVSYQFDEEKAIKELRCREFKDADLIWAQFIANNRNGFRYARMMNMSENNLRGQYELVIGQIADGQVSSITRTLQAEMAAVDETVLSNFRRKEYSTQYSFHSKPAIAKLQNGRLRLI